MNLYFVNPHEEDRALLKEIVAHRDYTIHLYDTALAFLDVCSDVPAGVAIIDICLPDLDGLTLQQELKSDSETDLPIIFLSGSCDITDAVSAMRRGAIDFLAKPIRRAEMLKALDRAEHAIEEAKAKLRQASKMPPLASSLTKREIEVLQASSHGESSKQVAHELGLSVRTIEMYRSHIIKKLQVPNFSAALLFSQTALKD